MRQFGECTEREAPALDDGISDAQTIGRAVAGRCYVEVDAMTEAYSAGMSPAGQRAWRSRMLTMSAEFATQTVLSLRASRR